MYIYIYIWIFFLSKHILLLKTTDCLNCHKQDCLDLYRPTFTLIYIGSVSAIDAGYLCGRTFDTTLQVLDVGHNHLLNVSVTNLMASQLNLLDMSLNRELKVDPKEFKTVK